MQRRVRLGYQKKNPKKLKNGKKKWKKKNGKMEKKMEDETKIHFVQKSGN